MTDAATLSGRQPLRPGTTVMVVAYQHEDYVEDTLRSILAQTRQPVEVLIADDASPTDDTRGVIERFVAAAPGPLRSLPNETNTGLNRTLNRLLAQVSTEFVTYIAGDDVMAPERIAVHEDLLRSSDDDIALAYSDTRVIDAAGCVLAESSREEFPWPEEPARSERTLHCLIESNWIPAASFFLRTELLRAAGGYAEDLFYEDFELLTRLAAQHRFTYVDRPLVDVRRLETSLGATGFVADSPRFLRSLFRALGHGCDAEAEDTRRLARSLRWAMAKRAMATDMPVAEVRGMLRSSWSGARSPVHALAHAARYEVSRLSAQRPDRSRSSR